MRQSCYVKASGDKIKWQGHYKWDTGEICPLYLDLDYVDGEHPLKHCDYKHTVFYLVKYYNSVNTNLELADKVGCVYDSITRVWELKPQKFSFWDFDYSTNILDTNSNKPNTKETFAILCIPYKRLWSYFCFIMGAYDMCRNGILRNDEKIRVALEYNVFPSLHIF